MLKNVLKAGALFFVVGALLAVAAPFIGAAVGIAPTVTAAGAALGHTASPLWMGAFFGMFGAIDAMVRPAFEKIFGGAKAAEKATAERVEGESPAMQRGKGEPCCAKHVDGVTAEAYFQEKLAAEKAAPSTAVQRQA